MSNMQFTTADGLTKADLVESYRGGPKGKARRGTLVRLVRDVMIGRPGGPLGVVGFYEAGSVVEVCDLFQRNGYDKPASVGCLTGRGVAHGFDLCDLELATGETEVRVTKH